MGNQVPRTNSYICHMPASNEKYLVGLVGPEVLSAIEADSMHPVFLDITACNALEIRYDFFNEKDWPGLSKEAAVYLREKRIKAVGTDALAIDVFGSADNPVHVELLGHGINVIENINRLWELPVHFAVIGLPCRLKDGSGSPLRLIALTD